MTRENGPTPSELTPTDLDYTHLPDQTMYKVEPDRASHFGQEGGTVRTYPLFVTNDFTLLYFEMDPGGTIEWHTHAPSFDEVCLCLDGRAIYTLQREDGTHQRLVLDAREFVYVPAGARHTIEAGPDRPHEGLVVMPSNRVGRLELLEGASPYETDDWPVALWVDRARDEVVERDTDAVSE
jgi:quercetin dioxygenase-like cupin family protein